MEADGVWDLEAEGIVVPKVVPKSMEEFLKEQEKMYC